jgi:hypothetical protein
LLTARAASLGMKVEDYNNEGRWVSFRLRKKGDMQHQVPAHHNAEDFIEGVMRAITQWEHACKTNRLAHSINDVDPGEAPTAL